MKLSQAGLEFIAGFEGYHRALPNGDCVAYRCIVGKRADGTPIHDGKWTIGFGCTEGVEEGAVWTRAQADAAYRRELVRFEDAVTRAVTAPVNQNQFDALVSFSYNCGEGALRSSSLLKKVNAGDFTGAAQAFAPWNRSKGVVVSGLVRRRAEEAALFRRPVEASAVPDMPQAVDAPETVPAGSRKVKTANAGQAVAATSTIALLGVPVADSFNYAQQLSGLVKTYGVHAAIVCLFLVTVAFALIKHFTKQDHEDGRYVSSGEAQ